MTLPFSAFVVLCAVFFWRVSVWLGIEDFVCSCKGALALVAVIALIAFIVEVL